MAEPTSEEIKSQIDAINNPPAGPVTPPAPVTPDKPASTPEPVQPGQVKVEPQPQSGQLTPVTSSQPDVQIVLPTAERITFEDLKKQTGIPDADALANSFKEAQKKITLLAEENKKLKTPESTPQPVIPATPAQPPLNRDELNARFVEDLAKDPVNTIARLVNAIAEIKVEPFAEDRKNILLQKEVMKLAASPETATISNPQVSEEMKKVAEEYPEFFVDLPKNLKKIHDMALGRLVSRGVVVTVNPQIVSQNPVPEGGKNKPSIPEAPFNVSKASAAEVAEHIKKLTSQGK